MYLLVDEKETDRFTTYSRRKREMLGIFLYAVIVTYSAADDVLSQDKKNKSIFTFKDYLEQFTPKQVWRDIEENNKLKGLNRTFKDELHNIISRIDETDELLSLKVKNGRTNILLDKDTRRQFKPPGDIRKTKYDVYSTRGRLVELIKQAIFQARNKMVIMQDLRQKYNKKSLYKMGFLIAKTDIACKAFVLFAYKSYSFCSMAKQYGTRGYSVMDNLEAKERLLDLWFDTDLLIDLVMLNHENCLRMLKQVISNRKNAWKFVD